jgi:hypothetical protein
MPNCVAVCPREQATFGAPSPGTVADDEIVCRAAFGMHIKGSKLTKSVIRKLDVTNGELSIWRVGDVENPTLGQLCLKITPPPNDAIDRLLAVQASEIRAIHGPQPASRAFSVVDDTRIDRNGGRDAQHAAIAPCRSYDLADPITIEDLVNKLFLLFKDRRVWP